MHACVHARTHAHVHYMYIYTYYTLLYAHTCTYTQLSYLSKGELEEVRIVYEWLKFMKKYGKLSHPSIFTGMCRDFHNIAIQGINECLLEKLAGELFVPWESDVKYANRTYFIQMDGVG